MKFLFPLFPYFLELTRSGRLPFCKSPLGIPNTLLCKCLHAGYHPAALTILTPSHRPDLVPAQSEIILELRGQLPDNGLLALELERVFRPREANDGLAEGVKARQEVSKIDAQTAVLET